MKRYCPLLLCFFLAGCLVRYIKAPETARNLDAVGVQAAAAGDKALADFNARKRAVEGARRVSAEPAAAGYLALEGLLAELGAQAEKISTELRLFNLARAEALKRLEGRKKLLSNAPEYKPFRNSYDAAVAGAARLKVLFAGYSELSGKAAGLMQEHSIASFRPADITSAAEPELARLDEALAGAEKNVAAALPGADVAAQKKISELAEILAALKARRVSLGVSLRKLSAAGEEIFAGPGTPHAALFQELRGIAADMEALVARYNAIVAGPAPAPPAKK